jgi:chemotaxis signal transduction protein
MAEAIVFEIDGEPMGLSLDIVAEVLRLGRLTPVPLGPPALLGATPWRGHVLPVLDVATLLRLPPGRPSSGDSCLRAKLGAHMVLLYVGRSLELERLDDAEADPARPRTASHANSSLLLQADTLLTLVEDEFARTAATWAAQWSAPDV